MTTPSTISPEPMPQEPEPAFVLHRGFWQKPMVQKVLPIATSVILHLGLVIFALVAYKAVEQITKQEPREQVVVTSSLDYSTEPGGIKNPGLDSDPNRSAAQDMVQDVEQSESWATQKNPELTASLMKDESGQSANNISIGPNTAVGPAGLGKGAGASGGPNLAPFGAVGGGGGLGPKVDFLGTGGGNATRVAFLCDGSGSMLQLRGLLEQELKKSINTLKIPQAFNVVIFQNEKPVAIDDNALMIANGDNKRKAYEFLEKLPASGQTNPIPALEILMRQKPQLIFMLTDGEFDNVKSYEEVLAYIRTANRDKTAKINTILLQSAELSEALDAADAQAEQTLKLIAKENGGKFTRVSTSSLQ